MRVFILSYWQLNSNQTAVNRILSFKKSLIAAGYNVLVFEHLHSNKSFKKSVRNRFRDWVTARLNNPFFNLSYSLFVSIIKREPTFTANQFSNGNELLSSFVLNENDIVFTSGPPQAIYGLGDQLKKQYKCKWIMDYRDPWTFGYLLPPLNNFLYKLKRLALRKREYYFLNTADAICTVSTSLKNFFPREYHYKISIIENGANSDYIDITRIDPTPTTFKIVYSGWLYNVQLKDESFFNALKQLITTKDIKPGELELCFLGSDNNTLLKKFIEKKTLTSYTRITPRVALKDAMNELYTASAFLHLRYGSATAIISSKIYDYLVLQKTIILPQSDNGDIAEMLKKYNVGFCCNSEKEVLSALSELYDKHQKQETLLVPRTTEELTELSRDFKTKRITELVNLLK